MWLLYLRTRLKPCSFLYPDFKLAFMINFHFYQNMVKLEIKYSTIEDKNKNHKVREKYIYN
jgi:hypothetical protein